MVVGAKTPVRTKGSRNRRLPIAEIIEHAEAGILPLEMLLKYMRGGDYEHQVKDRDGNLVVGEDGKPMTYMAPLSIRDRLQLAEVAAPYMHAAHGYHQ